jgi:hypothetical protein
MECGICQAKSYAYDITTSSLGWTSPGASDITTSVSRRGGCGGPDLGIRNGTDGLRTIGLGEPGGHGDGLWGAWATTGHGRVRHGDL